MFLRFGLNARGQSTGCLRCLGGGRWGRTRSRIRIRRENGERRDGARRCWKRMDSVEVEVPKLLEPPAVHTDILECECGWTGRWAGSRPSRWSPGFGRRRPSWRFRNLEVLLLTNGLGTAACVSSVLGKTVSSLRCRSRRRTPGPGCWRCSHSGLTRTLCKGVERPTLKIVFLPTFEMDQSDIFDSRWRKVYINHPEIRLVLVLHI